MKVNDWQGGFPITDTLKFFCLSATNILLQYRILRLFTHRIVSSNGVSKLGFSFESSNENTVFF